ncbi:hypothetical protein A3J23_04115 [Candidatus Peregrinibacteria bacterium RIFCSPLOWO2_02_FULL_48_14]|nr:MAG: hypothetical protein A3J23_04115 [Candidatus Peregrinibacteria bacterium RIFCSPLOWO2_02_FULL_48_14]
MKSFLRLLLSAPIDFAVGGQAVIEGVMMRSPNFYTVSVRNPEGKIEMKQEKFSSLTARWRILKLPLIRGMVHLVESMMIGFRSLNYSNAVFLNEGKEVKKERGLLLRMIFGFLGILYVLGTLAFTIFLLKVLPLWVAEKASELWPRVAENYFLFNAIDGLTKIVIFLSYILLISLAKDIWRVFQYHGAEHKSIWTYENGLALTVENARKQTRFHPRCGTSFIFIVILMSVFVYTLVPPADSFTLKLLERIAVIPLIAGISYELLKLSARHQKNFLMRLFTLPGLFIQRLTTKDPDDAQLEVALYSLKKSLAAEDIHVA